VAKIEGWEQRIRDDMERFAYQLNIAPGIALEMHAAAREEDPENIPEVSPEDSRVFDKLVKPARQHLLISEMVKAVIAAEEEEDTAAVKKAMRPVMEFTEGMTLRPRWVISDNRFRMSRELDAEDDEHPLVAASLVLWLDDYLNRHHGVVHLGVCRSCGAVYLKPKHGRKQRYCSRACQQRAYRERKAEREGESV